MINNKNHVSVNLIEKKCDFLKFDFPEGPMLIIAENVGEWTEKSLTVSLTWEQWEQLKTIIQAEKSAKVVA